jgi:3-dehydroquinate synthase
MRASGLPDGLTASGVDATPARLVEHMRHDKKGSGGKIPFLLARGVGQTYLDRDVDLSDVEAFLAEAR